MERKRKNEMFAPLSVNFFFLKKGWDESNFVFKTENGLKRVKNSVEMPPWNE